MLQTIAQLLIENKLAHPGEIDTRCSCCEFHVKPYSLDQFPRTLEGSLIVLSA